MKSFDIIIFGARDWSNNWVTQHRLAKSLSENKHRVLFIENTGVRSARIKDLSRVFERIKNWYKSIGGFTEVNKNLTIYSPLVLPFPYNNFIKAINTYILKKNLSKWIEKNKFNSINYITFLATPLIENFISNTNYFSKIYYCGDDHEEASNNSNFAAHEKKLATSSNLVLATSQKLYERLVIYNKNTHKISAGVELDKFDLKKTYKVPDDIKKIKKPIIGYIGGLNKKIDTDLIIKIAKERKNYSFVFIGENDGDFENKKNIYNQKNIFFLGKKPHSEIPNYISYFDCGIIPYKINKFTDAVYPSKLNEFLSMGKQVVSTDFYEMSFFNNENLNKIFISNKTNFAELIDKTLNNKNNDYELSSLVSIAKKNEWKNKFNKIYNLILETNNRESNYNLDWQKNFKIEYLKLQKKIKSYIYKVLILFFLIFISPIPYYIGNFLIINNSPKNNILLVALSGYGKTNYQNNSYQQRALDVFYYYKTTQVEKILLSGRKQLLEEFLLMKSILINLGIPETKIDIINQKFDSTYTNLILVNKYMDEKNYSEANIVTSPYHQKRVKVVFDKISKDKSIYLIPESNNEKKRKWFFSLNKIRVIAYEYLSIIYNYIKY